MPALFALAQHDALVEADGNLMPSERILSFLDDIYVVTTKERAKTAFDEVSSCIQRQAGVRPHLGKLRAWSRRGGAAPPDLAAFDKDIWVADRPAHENGIVALGTLLVSPEFVQAHAAKRMEKEQHLLTQICKLPDPQHAWVMLSQSAVPRANNIVRILPPALSRAYATAHDDAVWHTFCTILGATHLEQDSAARKVASMPGRYGGLGLRDARRTAAAAH